MGRPKKLLGSGFVLAGAFVYAFWMGGCDRTPTSQVLSSATDYVAYFADLNTDNWVFGYHVLSGQLDSFSVPALPEPTENINRLLTPKVVVSADGRSIYIALPDSTLLVNIADPSQTVVLPFPAGGGVSVSPDGRYVGILGDGGVNILSTSDYSQVFHDTDQVVRGQFSQDSHWFYATHWGGYAYRVNLESTDGAERRYCTDWSLSQTIPAPSGENWFLMTNDDGCAAAIEVYDAEGSTGLGRYIYAGFGEIELSPDGKHLPFTHPLHPFTTCDGVTSSFSVFDTETKTIQKVDVALDSADMDVYHDLPWWPIMDLETTPDGRWLVVSGRDVIAVVDAATLELDHYALLNGRSIVYLTIQNSP